MVGGSFLRQLERDRDRAREGERATGHVMDRWAASRARREGAISRKGQRYSLLHDTMAATYGGGALLLGKSNLAPVGCRQ